MTIGVEDRAAFFAFTPVVEVLGMLEAYE